MTKAANIIDAAAPPYRVRARQRAAMRVGIWPAISGALMAVVGLSGCAALPHDPAPAIPRAADSVPIAQTLASAGQGPADAALAPRWPYDNSSGGGGGADRHADQWWTRFGDPQLDALIAEGLANSPDVLTAAARLRAAGAAAQQARAATLPILDLQGQVSAIKESYNQGPPPQFIPHGINGFGQLDATFAFDLDLWGKNRALLRAATSDAQAARIDVAQARLMLTTAIAAAYIQFSLAVDALAVRADELANRTALRDLVAKRQTAGLDNLGSVRAADADNEIARVTLADAELTLAMRRHALAALVGAGPDRGLALSTPMLAPTAALALPDDVTTALVARRPDIAAARIRLESAASRVKAARADFYPAIRLSALVGLQSLGLSQLFTTDSTYGNVGPAVTLPVFHGGSLRGALRARGAAFDEAVADYDRAVIAAYQQVADAVTGRVLDQRQLVDATLALAALNDAATIGRGRYRSGLSTYLDVLTLEDRALEARVTGANIAAATRAADVALARALGGGWFDADAAAHPGAADAARAPQALAKDIPHG